MLGNLVITPKAQLGEEAHRYSMIMCLYFVYTFPYMTIYVHICAYMRIEHTCIYIYIYMYIHIPLYIYIYTHSFQNIKIYVYTYIYPSLLSAIAGLMFIVQARSIVPCRTLRC